MNNNYSMMSHLLESSKGNFYLFSGRERDIDILKRRSTELDKQSTVKIIRGQRCSTKESLFQEFAAALQFPYYFGYNWDAFDECITDLSWLSSDRYMFLITNFDKVLVDNKKDLHTFLNVILKEAISYWNKTSQSEKITPLYIIFHCEDKNKEECKQILEQENIHPYIKLLEPSDNIS